jgi:hypothetical protein
MEKHLEHQNREPPKAQQLKPSTNYCVWEIQARERLLQHNMQLKETWPFLSSTQITVTDASQQQHVQQQAGWWS